MYYNKLNRLSFGLSRQLWVVEAGIFLNMLGYGAVLPFEIIYLHEARGFSLGVAGLVVGLVTGVAILSAPIAGALIDSVGARTTAVVAGSPWRAATAAWRSQRRRRRRSPPRRWRASGTVG
jgi:MFS family permease